MAKIGELYKQADWKTEKHVPVMECPDSVGADRPPDSEDEVSGPDPDDADLAAAALTFGDELAFVPPALGLGGEAAGQQGPLAEGLRH